MNENKEQIKNLVGIWQKVIGIWQGMLTQKKGINYITIHHSASPLSTTIDEINEWHRLRDFTLSSLGWYIGYHYLVFSDGHIVQTRLDTEMGCNVLNHNRGNIGICLVGNFNNYAPTKEQWDALVGLIAEKKAQYFVDDKEIKCHSDWYVTECPGENLRVMVKARYNQRAEVN